MNQIWLLRGSKINPVYLFIITSLNAFGVALMIFYMLFLKLMSL